MEEEGTLCVQQYSINKTSFPLVFNPNVPSKKGFPGHLTKIFFPLPIPYFPCSLHSLIFVLSTYSNIPNVLMNWLHV